MRIIPSVRMFGLALMLLGFTGEISAQKQPVDFVNPYMGNISHLLVPTFPTIHLPNSLLRVYPERGDYTGDLLRGLPVTAEVRPLT